MIRQHLQLTITITINSNNFTIPFAFSEYYLSFVEKQDDILRKRENLNFTYEYDTTLNILNHILWFIFVYSVSTICLRCFPNIFFNIEIKNQLHVHECPIKRLL